MPVAFSSASAGLSQESIWLSLLARIAARLSQDERSLRFIDGVFAELAGPLALDTYLYYQADKEHSTLTLLAYRGIDEAAAEEHDLLSTPPCSTDSGCVWPAELAGSTPRLPDLSAELDLPVGAHLPLIAGGRCLGSLLVGRRSEPFSPAELGLLKAVCSLIAAGLDRGRLRFQLQTEHARFQALLDHLPAAVMLAEASSGRIVLGNPQAERILGRPVSSDGSEASEPEPAELKLLRALSGEDTQAIDYLFQRADGTKTWLRASGSPIRDPQGRVIGSLITCYDIDERMRMQQELLKADRSKDQFLAFLGHELRNPLSAISYAVSLLEMGSHDAESRQALELMRGQLAQVSRLIEDLLDLSRVKQGKIAINTDAVDLNEIVSRAVEVTRPLFEQRAQVLEMALSASPLMLQADPLRLEQVIVNLLNNAAKYSEQGGQIGITTEAADGQACLRVRDNGIGMTPETLGCVFDLYTQDSAARDRSEGGLGIGLALVDAVVKLHGGTVAAHSEGLGRGSEFTVLLPLYSARPSLPAAPA
jgi:PAS domain S-box-containing protein